MRTSSIVWIAIVASVAGIVLSSGVAIGQMVACGMKCVPNKGCGDSTQDMANLTCTGYGGTCGPVCDGGAQGNYCAKAFFASTTCTMPSDQGQWAACGQKKMGTCIDDGGFWNPSTICGGLSAPPAGTDPNCAYPQCTG